MRRNNYKHCNPRQYEEHLSPFGRKVLNILIKQGNTESERQSNLQFQTRRYPAQNRILTFRDSNIPETQAPVDHMELNSEKNDLYRAENLASAPFVPTSAQLVTMPMRAGEVNTANDNCCFVSRDDLIDPTVVVDNSKSRNVVLELYTKSSVDDNTSTLVSKLKDDTNNKSSIIDWNDMFDTGLFTEIDVPTAAILKDIRKDLTKEKQFQFKFPDGNETALHSDEPLKRSIKTYKGIKDENSKKLSKRKNQSKITDTAPKKVKKVAILATECTKTVVMNSLRKQKYTKTVKNWLNNIDPSNTVEGETLDPSEVSEAQTEFKNKINKPEITINKAFKGKTINKKIVQAQLANKDGVMKFQKPKHVKNLEKSKLQEKVEAEIEVTKDNTHKDTSANTRPKFVAPIKGQVPLKDVSFQVHTVDNTNITEHGRDLCNLENKDVMAVLVYSNGFCQLNNHHTNDTCNAEGIMIHGGDNFYYLKGNDERYREILMQILKQNNIVCYDGKNIFIYLMSQFQMEFKDVLNIIDAKIGGSLVEPDSPPENFSEVQKLVNCTAQYTIAAECALQRSAWSMTLLKECMSMLKSVLIQDSLWNVFIDIEMRLLPIIADMEWRGVCVDVEKLASMENIIETRMRAVEAECHRAAGRAFCVGSAAQVRALLYDELRLDRQCQLRVRETAAKGAKSTSETMLRTLVGAHPLPRLILEYRHLHKARATFLTGIAQQARDGRVRPTWEQSAASTGRVACSAPNLQAIPKAPFSLTAIPDPDADDTDAAGAGAATLRLRSVYVSRAGHTLLAADFRHVECRVLAAAAADAALLAALRSPHDLFRVLAAKWLDKPEPEVSAAERERTKRVVYACAYGAGARRLADALAAPIDHALDVAASFNRTFPSLRSFGQAVSARCLLAGGCVRTPSGRVRRLPHIASADAARRAHAERQALNFVVQGTAADVCKTAMSACAARLLGAALRCRLVLQVHDELVWEVRDDHLHSAAAVIKSAMEACGAQCGVPVALPVALAAGRSWGDMRALSLAPAAPAPAPLAPL